MEVTQEKWTEITVTVDTKDIETAGNIANMVVPYGIYIEDYSALEEETMEIAHIDLIEASLLQKDRTKGIIHIYISPEENPAEAVSFLEERLQSAGIAYTLGTDLCAMEDWVNNWKKYFHPMPVGWTRWSPPVLRYWTSAAGVVFFPLPLYCWVRKLPLA